MKSLKSFLGREVWQLFVLAVFVGLLWFAVEASFIFVLQTFIVAIGLVEASRTSLPSWMPNNLAWATLSLVVFGCVRGLVWMLRYFFSGVTGQTFVREQKQRILEIALRHAHELASYDVVTLFNDEVQMAGQALQASALLVTNTISVFCFLVLGAYWAPAELVISIGLLSLIVFPAKWVDGRVKILGARIVEQRESVNRVLLTGLKNNYFLRICDLLAMEVAKGKTALHIYEKSYKRFFLYSGSRGALPLILGACVIIAITAVSVTYIKTPGAHLLAFFYIFLRMAQGVADALTCFGEVRMQGAGLKRLFQWNQKFYQLETQAVDVAALHEQCPEFKQIETQAIDLSFSYGDKPILKNINFRVLPGQTLLLKGASGSGKTTLLSLILGLLHPMGGIVTINHKNPSQVFGLVAPSIGYVGPDPFLIAGSVRENLLYGHYDRSSVNDLELWQALRAAQIAEHVGQMPFKLETELREHSQLSTGQKQRFAIARALLRNPSLLILDEATANLDFHTEKRFIDWLSGMKGKFTVVVVSHRDSFDELADVIVELGRDDLGQKPVVDAYV